MEKTALKLYEFYNLEAELNGVTNQQTGESISKGLLSEKIKLTTKYWINDLVKKVSAEKEACEAIKTELIKKHGTPDEEGNVTIPMYINIVKDEEGKILSAENNPTFAEFQKEFNTLLNEEKEIEHKEFQLEDFENVETEGTYITFLKLVKAGE
jgi:hypothetical protein